MDVKAIEEAAHGGYVAAINSNDLDTWLTSLTDDVVYQAPGAPEIVGKAALREWGTGYFAAYTTKWEKTSLGFTVNGDWAFERYTLQGDRHRQEDRRGHDRHRQGHPRLPQGRGRQMARGDRRVEFGQPAL